MGACGAERRRRRPGRTGGLAAPPPRGGLPAPRGQLGREPPLPAAGPGRSARGAHKLQAEHPEGAKAAAEAGTAPHGPRRAPRPPPLAAARRQGGGVDGREVGMVFKKIPRSRAPPPGPAASGGFGQVTTGCQALTQRFRSRWRAQQSRVGT